MKNINPFGIFDDDFLLDNLSKPGDPLQKLNEYIDWNIFKEPINVAFRGKEKDSSKGGWPPFDKLMLC
jgi:hypothetical protein